MAEADAAHPWDGQNVPAQHANGRADQQPPDRHDRTAPAGDPVHGGRPGGRPGSDGERLLQSRLGTAERAERFYDEQVLDHLNERMRDFVQRQEMFFLATADSRGECDSSFRAGPPGFLQVLGERTLVYPEYRGNGVNASLGNIQENPHLGIMLIDFTRARIGLHINGRATLVDDEEMRAAHPQLAGDPVPGRRPQMWVQVEVEEAYIHCAKHIPQLQRAPRRTARDWGTDDYKRKGGDFFGAARDTRDRGAAAAVDEGAAREHVPASEPAAGSRSAEATGRSELAEDTGRSEPAEATGRSEPAEATGRSEPVERSERVTAAGAHSDSSSVYDELPGYAREEAHSEPASVSPADTAADPAERHDDAVPTWNRDDVWKLPPMPPPPQMPSISLGQGASSPMAETAWPVDSVWPASSGLTAADGASGAMAARGPLSPGLHAGGGADPDAWRQEAERALAEAQRRGSPSERGSFQSWFG